MARIITPGGTVEGENRDGRIWAPVRDLLETLGGHRLAWDTPTGALYVDCDPAPEQPPAPAQTLTDLALILDYGHGQSDLTGVGDPGAVDGVNPAEGDYIDTKEDNLVALYGKELKSWLEARGALVFETRAEDNFLSLEERVNKANRLTDQAIGKKVFFLSVHANAAGNTSALGFEAYSLAATGNGRQVAEAICKEVALAGLPVRGAKTANFYVLRATIMPACLVEIGFITNPQEEQKLHDEAYRTSLIESMGKGLEKVFGG